MSAVQDVWQRWCPGCEKWLEVGAFRTSTRTHDGYDTQCRDCRNRSRRHGGPGARRPAGALCVRCEHRPARMDQRWNQWVTLFCSETCQVAWYREKHRAEHLAAANRIRQLLGMPTRPSTGFAAGETKLIVRRLERLLPNPMAKTTKITDRRKPPRMRRVTPGDAK